MRFGDLVTDSLKDSGLEPVSIFIIASLIVVIGFLVKRDIDNRKEIAGLNKFLFEYSDQVRKETLEPMKKLIEQNEFIQKNDLHIINKRDN